MTIHRHENARYLGQRWDRYLQLLAHKDIWDAKDIRAAVPRAHRDSRIRTRTSTFYHILMEPVRKR